MDNTTQQTQEPNQNTGKVDYVVLRKNELIDILKALEGLKKKLQPLLTTDR